MAEQINDTNPNVVERVPSTWPGAFGLLKHSKEVVRVNLGTTLVLAILAAVLSGAPNRDQHHVHPGLLVVSSLISAYVSLLLYYTLLKGTRGEKVALGQTLDISGQYFKYLLNSIVSGFLVVLSFALLIVPGIFVMPRLALSGLFVIDQKLGPIEAIKASWEATRGHIGMIWGIIGAEIAFALLMITIIGIPFALYFLFMYLGATPIAYRYLTRNEQASAPTSPAA